MNLNLQELFEFVVARNVEAASAAGVRGDPVAAQAHHRLHDLLSRKRSDVVGGREVSAAERRGLEDALRRMASSYDDHPAFRREWLMSP
ncbi:MULTISPECIES: hypothetical protein [unclassified Nocardioides]|uniref:hypothetical protein n=1 Tax=unclassified Nocardioides TaxID=2615069 RepID=UPI0030149735